ncbi:UDP-3-O-acyl-N-acetylglucosamine deacetylase [Candidatus Entotheonellaceae bacterium PAL068K]
MDKSHILIVDDDERFANTLLGILRQEGFGVSYASDGNQALTLVQTQAPDVILLDVWLPGMDGIEILQTLQGVGTVVEVIMMSGHGNIATAVKTTKLGASEYLEKPFSPTHLLHAVRRAVHRSQHRRSACEPPFQPFLTQVLIGDSPQINAIRRQSVYASTSDQPILIQGEDGSGRNLLARLLHNGSERRDSPFVVCRCTDVSESTAARLLFGADGDVEREPSSSPQGMFEAANGGTLFLDDIDSLQPEMQHQLLRMMTVCTWKRGRGELSRSPNPRLMASCRIPLAHLRTAGRLLSELAIRFQPLYIELPPLSARQADIPILVRHFLHILATQQKQPPKDIHPDAMRLLLQYPWPGNIRELRDVIQRLVRRTSHNCLSCHEVSVALHETQVHSSLWHLAGHHSPLATQRVRQPIPSVSAASNHPSSVSHMPRHPDESAAFSLSQDKGHDVSFPLSAPSQPQKQKTLSRSMVLYGQGLQTGLKTGIILAPLPPNSGIIFSNITTGETFPASILFVESTDFSICLRKGRGVAKTVEHLMSVLHAYRITNLLIKIGEEIPIMDGSAAAFCQSIQESGVEEQEARAEEFVVDQCYHIGNGNLEAKSILVEPYNGFRITYRLAYPQPVGVQEFTYEHHDGASFCREIARARTFGFVRDIEQLHKLGLLAGGRLNNVILLDDEKVVNSGDLRFPDEYARHKVLDLMGDLYLLGMALRGHVRANMTGHTENAALVRQLYEAMQRRQ